MPQNVAITAPPYKWLRIGIVDSIRSTVNKSPQIPLFCPFAASPYQYTVSKPKLYIGQQNINRINLCCSPLWWFAIFIFTGGLFRSRWWNEISQIARFMEPTWGPPGICRSQVDPMLAPWTLLLGIDGEDQWRVITTFFCQFSIDRVAQLN